MDVSKVLAALRRERAQIEEVIVNLERLEQCRERRRGRPPAILTSARKRGRPRGSKNKNTMGAGSGMAPAEHTPRVMAAGHSAAADTQMTPSDLM